MTVREPHPAAELGGPERPAVTVREAMAEDLAQALEVQRHAFARVARALAIDPHDLPPLRESLADLLLLAEAGARFFVATAADTRIVGTVRAQEISGTVDIGRLAVDDGFERQGIASALMDAVEHAFPKAHRFRLFTGADAAAPLSLYAGRGYAVSHVENAGPVELVWLEKPGEGATDVVPSR